MRRAWIGCAHNLAASNDRDAIRDRLNLAQFVGDEHDRCALILQLPHDLHELIGFLRREHRRGLVENKNLGAARKRLDDLDSLLRTDGEIFDLCVRVDVEAEALGDFAHLRACLVEVEEGALRRLVAERHVFRNGEDRDEHEVLVHHADTGGHSISGAREMHGLIIDKNLAAVGLIEPVQNVHEGGLTRAVFAEERMNFALVDDQVNVVIGYERAEHLRDASQFEFHERCLP